MFLLFVLNTINSVNQALTFLPAHSTALLHHSQMF
jgi:hypothetical protein